MILAGKSKRFIPVLFGILFLANLLAWLTVYELNQPQLLEVVFFDVGQGDSIFIGTPQGHQILIDGGPTLVVLEKLNKEMPFWDRNIDLVILTHPERDHMAGLIEVLRSYEVENILWTGIIRDTAEYEEWKRCLEEEKARIIIAKAGQKVKAGGVQLDILHPFENLEGQTIKNSNNSSIITRLVFGQNSFLFTGDVYKSVEKKLVDREVKLNSDILKVGHHGSKTSNGKEFIERVLPEIAVIQVGKDNSYSHPHQETLETLENYDIKILRTDLHGDIKIICDSQSLKLKLKE